MTGAQRWDLSDLVKARRAEFGLALRPFADRCIDPETGEIVWKHGQIERLEKRLPVIPPQLPQLRGLAAGLQVPLGEVQDAAARQFFGIDTVRLPGGGARALLHLAEQLSEEDQAKVMALLEAWGSAARQP